MWLFFALTAYALFAAATIADKYLLTRPIPDARVYSFYSGILGVFVILLAPFGLETSNYLVILLGILAGAVYGAALFMFFSALRIGEVSRMGISIGGLIPIFTLFFVYLWTKETPNFLQLIAFITLVSGSFVIVFERFIKLLGNLKRFVFILASSFLFGLYFALAKFLFGEQSFVSTIVWIRIGAVLFALLFLLSPSVRRTLAGHKKALPKKAGLIMILKNAAGGTGSLLQHLAIATARIPEVSLVSALQGVQFVIVFFGAVFLTRKFPGIVKEEIHKEAIIVKTLGTALILAGIILLALA